MYLLDGNNIMGQRIGWHRDIPAAMRRLIDELQRLARRMNTEVAVVFDAPAGKPSERFGHLEVLYARKHETADDRIVHLARQCRGEEQSLIAVTSDRDLSRRLAECGVAVIRAGVFRRMLDSCQSSAPKK
jgi:predicted RNA-binding protein with PIN domain